MLLPIPRQALPSIATVTENERTTVAFSERETKFTDRSETDLVLLPAMR